MTRGVDPLGFFVVSVCLFPVTEFMVSNRFGEGNHSPRWIFGGRCLICPPEVIQSLVGYAQTC